MTSMHNTKPSCCVYLFLICDLRSNFGVCVYRTSSLPTDSFFSSPKLLILKNWLNTRKVSVHVRCSSSLQMIVQLSHSPERRLWARNTSSFPRLLESSILLLRSHKEKLLNSKWTKKNCKDSRDAESWIFLSIAASSLEINDLLEGDLLLLLEEGKKEEEKTI